MARKGIFGSSSDFDSRYVADYEKLGQLISHVREMQPDVKIVFTGGVWDLIHLGHLAYMEKAREFGDFLVVGIDSDELARSRKKVGEIDRPIVNFEERARILSYLRSVDLLTVVESDIEPILRAIQPDVLVVSTTTGDLPPEKYEYYKAMFNGKIEPLLPQAPPEKVSSTARIRGMMVNGLKLARAAMAKSVSETFDALEKSI